VFGTPAPTVNRYVKNIGDIGSDDDVRKDIMRIINYSDYVINNGGKEKDKFAKTKATQKQIKKLLPNLYGEIDKINKSVK
jgi:hypothetical protein